MGMPALDRARRWTRDEVLALPDDGNRYELVDGELLVSPSPRWVHQHAVGGFWRIIDDYVKLHRIGDALFSPADLDLRSGQVLQPDIFVVDRVDGRRAREWTEVGIPRLVVEVLSPTHPEFDRVKKRRRYQKSGVSTYWIVDLDARHVEVWTPQAKRAEIITDTLTWRPEPHLPAFRLDLIAFFKAVHDE